jgi:ribonuclease T1
VGLCPDALKRGLSRAAAAGLSLGLTLVLALMLALGVAASATARTPDLPTDLPPVALAALPAQAKTTYQRILSGGPFPYEKDGTVFRNRERLLPIKTRGHYREYTVRTPGASNRGARRIVCGGQPPTQPEVCFYTADHYASFRRIVP